jgi:hypothetical protein
MPSPLCFPPPRGDGRVRPRVGLGGDLAFHCRREYLALFDVGTYMWCCGIFLSRDDNGQSLSIDVCDQVRIGVSDNPKVKVGLPEVNIGMQLPVFGTKLAEMRLQSPAAFNRAVLLGDTFTAIEATDAGFLDQLVPGAELGAAAAAEAARLSEFCKEGFAATKINMRGEAIRFIRASGPAKL